MKGRFVLLVATALVAGDGAQVLAQRPIEVGDRVRVIGPGSDDDPIEGKLREVHDESLVLRDEWGLTREISVSSVTRLEIGRPARGRGAVRGGLVGLAVGAALGVAIVFSPEQGTDWSDRVGFGLACLPLGFGIGAAVGAISADPIWEPVPVDRLRVGVQPGATTRWTIVAEASF